MNRSKKGEFQALISIFLLLGSMVVMQDFQSASAALVPSQVCFRNHRRLVKRQGGDDDLNNGKVAGQRFSLIPSQVPGARHRMQATTSQHQSVAESRGGAATVLSQSNTTTTTSKVGKSRRKVQKKKKSNNNTANKARILTGDLPDLHWRAVPMDHLRHHPHFDPLPPAESIAHLDRLEDVRQFRQDSWQWDALHEGRCTTSQAAAALGFLEPHASNELNIPLSWRRGGVSAYYRMKQKALRTLDEMNQALCPEVGVISERPWSSRKQTPSAGPIWTIPKPQSNGKRFPFAAKYLPRTTPQDREKRRQTAEQNASNGMLMSVRMRWGNTQEATALLCALNYFWRQEPGISLQEVGMCGAGLEMNQTDSSLLVGASPDGLLVYPDGKVEVLEVKNHCPFVPAKWATERYSVLQKPFREMTIPPLYIPQLMMEMLCVGADCRSAIMVRLTATNGAAILRLHRDDEWIDEMLFWLHRFQQEYVEKETPPPSNFFWDDETLGERYRNFVERTNELSSNVEVLDHCKHTEVQRVLATHRNITSLFLD